MFDPNKVVVWRGLIYEGCFREDGKESDDHGDDCCYHSNGPFVKKAEYDDLREKYNLLLAAEPVRVVPYKNGFWVFAKGYCFFAERPENGQKEENNV